MMMKQLKYYGHFHSLLLLPSSCFIIIMSAINTFFATLTLKITHQSIRTKEFGPVLTCKHDWWHYRRLQILWSIALKLQIGRGWQKGIEILKIHYYASNGYQYYGESGQDTNTKLFWKSVVWKFDIWDSSLVFFLE